jgi:hypothetical protein
MPHAHVSPAVEHALIRQYAVGGHQVLDQLWVGAAG